MGGGFAGAATACFLARSGVGDVVLFERERTCGAHASGRNAALCRQLADDDATTALTVRGARFLRAPPPEVAPGPLVSSCGSFLVVSREETARVVAERAARAGLAHERVAVEELVRRWPLLAGTPATCAFFFPGDGVIDIHGLLQGYLAAARAGGVTVLTGCDALSMRDAGSGATIETTLGRFHARRVVIAAGAWSDGVAARAGAARIGLLPFRRHLFITTRGRAPDAGAPFVWHLDEPFYVRPEAGALLLSACDQDPHPPGPVAPSPEATLALAERLVHAAPPLADLAVVRSWACLRTFTPDRLSVIAWDPGVRWLFRVVGLGGHGATASAAIGALAAARIRERLS